MVRTNTGRRRRPLGSLRALWDRSAARRHLPARRAYSSANLTRVSSTDRCPSRPLRRGEILIANLELEFHVSPIRITKLGFSNRKYSPLFPPPWRIAISRSALSYAVAHCPLRLRRHGAGGLVVSRFLIVTPRLEFRAIKTKQTPSSIPNRYKMRFSHSGSQGENQRKGAGRRPAVRTAKAKEPAPRTPSGRGQRAGCRRYKGESQRYKNGAETKAKRLSGALRLRQRRCGIELWSDLERLRCT
jgi:hypothetical protein